MKPHPAVLALLLPTAAIAAPSGTVYLECTTGGPIFNLTMDEANGVLTYHVPSTGFSERIVASFGPETVSAMGRSVKLLIKRTDLRMAREFSITRMVEAGTCRVVVPPKRAF
jgi:hypothetical protein